MTRPEAIRFCLQSAAGLSGHQREVEAANVPYLTIPLHGLHGTGKEMLVAESDWVEGVASGWPKQFGLTRNFNSGRFYVTTSKRPISPDGQPVPLSRLIVGAALGDIVAFANGETLDLRRSNLVKLSRAEAAAATWAKRCAPISAKITNIRRSAA